MRFVSFDTIVFHLVDFTSQFGVTTVVELKEGGAHIPVTNENKREFVQLSAQYRLTNSIKEQLNALLGGFYDVIPKDLISIVSTSS